jgi:dynein heavy chain
VSEFAAVTEALAERMQSGGPGLPTVQLAAGAEQLRTLQAEVDALGKQQEELRLAEQLFGMDVTGFPHLNKVCSTTAGQEHVCSEHVLREGSKAGPRGGGTNCCAPRVWADLFGHVAAVQVEAELRRLAQIYAIFSEYTEVVRQYSSMLWSELDIGSLMQGVEGVAGKLKKLKGLEGMPVFGLVQAEIAGFADSLPLMKELKSEALR